MKVRWLGWAGVEIEAEGAAVVIDPNNGDILAMANDLNRQGSLLMDNPGRLNAAEPEA